MGKNNAYLPNIDALVQMGINPATGLPYKLGASECCLKDGIKKALRVLDEQNAINRYKWYNLPGDLDGQLLERILYYKGQGAFFYLEATDSFYFLPYALDGTIDVYGRYTGITPLPFNGKTEVDEKKKAWITGLIKKPVYKLDEITIDDFTDGCVLISDYSKQISQTTLARQMLQEPIIDAMAEAYPFARTSLIANSGIKGMRVNDEDQKAQVKSASRSVTNAALTGDPWVPFVGNIDFQDFTSNGSPLKAEEYLLYMQSLDSFRLSLYGLSNGGLFQKKAHMLQAEENMNAGNTGLVYQDGLTIRQKFCDFVNAIWGLGVWVEPSETVTNMDQNMDGMVNDQQDQSGVPGEQDQTAMAGGDDNDL